MPKETLELSLFPVNTPLILSTSVLLPILKKMWQYHPI